MVSPLGVPRTSYYSHVSRASFGNVNQATLTVAQRFWSLQSSVAGDMLAHIPQGGQHLIEGLTATFEVVRMMISHEIVIPSSLGGRHSCEKQIGRLKGQ